MTIEELLREQPLRDALAVHYARAIAEAEVGYEYSAADEDAVTGALGERMRGGGVVVTSIGVFKWKTTYRKLRGRGPGAPEKRLGGDGVFELMLEDASGVQTGKSLFFQSKNQRYAEAKLRDQARRLASLPGGSIVIQYGPDGYVAEDAEAVATRAGSSPQRASRLATILAHDFPDCHRGSSLCFYDATREAVILATPNGPIEVRRLPLSHRIKTLVTPTDMRVLDRSRARRNRRR